MKGARIGGHDGTALDQASRLLGPINPGHQRSSRFLVAEQHDNHGCDDQKGCANPKGQPTV
jgi:hypothetical protein